jgi:hypothetical protein
MRYNAKKRNNQMFTNAQRLIKIMFLRELQEKQRSKKLKETHIPAKAVCAAADNIIAPTANNKIHSIITARSRAPFGLQNNPNNIHYTAKKRGSQ